MWKLAIILYAAFVIASGKLAGAVDNGKKDIVYPAELAVINRQTVNRHINQSIEKIKERSAEMYRQVLQLGPQRGDKKLSVIVPFSRKVSENLQTMVSFIDHYVTVASRGPFNPSACLGHFAVYSKAVRTHEDELVNRVSYDVYNKTTLQIGQLLHMTNGEISKISSLRVRAKTCNQLECNNISKTAKDIVDAYHKQTDTGLADYLNMVDNTAIEQELDVAWNYWLDMGLEVMQSIYDCIFHTH